MGDLRQELIDFAATLLPGQLAHLDRTIDAGYGVADIRHDTVHFVNVNDPADRKWATYTSHGHVYAGRS